MGHKCELTSAIGADQEIAVTLNPPSAFPIFAGGEYQQNAKDPY